MREFKAALETVGIEAVSIGEVVKVPEPEETGTTFLANARIKAQYYMEACGLPCLADDSGLAVDVLDGAPAYIRRGMRALNAMMRRIIINSLNLLKTCLLKKERHAMYVNSCWPIRTVVN